jgi:cytochrome P450
MALASEIDLPHLPVDDPAFRADPFAAVEEARKRHPWLATTDYGLLIHGYQAIKDIVYQDDKMHPSFDGLVEYYGVQGTPWAKFQVEQILGHSGEKHQRIRKSVGDAFTPRNVNRYIDVMRKVATDLLDIWAPKGKCDFAEFASNYPIAVLCAVMGTSTEEIPSIKRALEIQTALLSMDHAIVPELVAGYDILYNYSDKVVREREAKGPNDGDLLDQLIAARDAGQIDQTELLYLLMILFPAGYDTSKNMLTLTMWQMLKTPEHWVKCAESLDYAHKITEEMFRYCSTATQFRLTDADVDYDGVTIPRGSTLIFANNVAGRDRNAIEDADLFDPERVHKQRHISFGRGSHICLGQHLAKMQIGEGLHLMAQRIRNPRLAGEVTWRPFMGVWGLETLPIEFDPA